MVIIYGYLTPMKLKKSFPAKLRIPADGGKEISNKKGSDTPLMPEDHHLYRKGIGVLLYLAPETPDILFTLKSPAMKLASPTEGDVELLRLRRKYLKGCPDIHLLHKTRIVPRCSSQEIRNQCRMKLKRKWKMTWKSGLYGGGL